MALALTVLLAWAGYRIRSPLAPGSPSRMEGRRAVAGKAARALPEVRTLREQEASAYHARLFAEEDSVVLVTPDGFTTFRADGSTEMHPFDLGPVVARHGDALVFWRSGNLREVSLSGQHEHQLAPVREPPRYLLASQGRLAWVHADREAGASLQALVGGNVRVVYESASGVSAPAMRETKVYWVAASPDGSWSIARADLDEQDVVSSEPHHGRPPAMLAVGHDGVYFYDGPRRGVRRLTFDLKRETAVSGSVVCSPLAVASEVVCAQVGGLFSIRAAGKTPWFLAPERAGPVTALAVTSDRAFWVAENGDERLVARTVALPRP